MPSLTVFNASVRLFEITAVEYFIDIFDILTQKRTKYILHSVDLKNIKIVNFEQDESYTRKHCIFKTMFVL